MPSSRRNGRGKATQGHSVEKAEVKGSVNVPETSKSMNSAEPIIKGSRDPTVKDLEEEIDKGNIDMEGVENMEDVLRMAAKIKMAHLADQRKEWDMAPQFMKNTLLLHKDPDVTNARLSPGKERLEAATQMKNDGNEAYNKGDNVVAIDAYTKALSTFRYFVQDGERFDLVSAHDSYGPEEKAEMERLLVNVYVNLAACLLRSKEAEGAMYACNEALKIEEGNMKALYRRAMARAMTEITPETLELIIRDLSSAAFADPNNQDVKAALRKFRQAKAEEEQTAKKDFGGMFERGEIYKQTGKETTGVRKRPGIHEEGSGELDAEKWAEEARRMGINIEETWVKKKLERMRNKGRSTSSASDTVVLEAKSSSVVPPWRRKMYKHFDIVFDKTRWLSLPTLMKAIIVANIVYRFWTLWQMWSAKSPDSVEEVEVFDSAL